MYDKWNIGRHSRESGNPLLPYQATFFSEVDSRFRGNDGLKRTRLT